MLSRLVITFLLRSKCVLISWLQSLSAVILEPPIINSVTILSAEISGLITCFCIFDLLLSWGD